MSHSSRRCNGSTRALRKQRRQRHIIITRGDRIRSFVLTPRWFVLGFLLVTGLVGGAVAGGAYLLDQQTIGAAVAQNDLRTSYELRIAELSRQIDSLVSRQMVDRSAIEQQVAELAERQQALNERQQQLTGLATDAIRVGVDVLPVLAPVPHANPLRGGIGTESPPAVGGPLDPITTGAIDLQATGLDPLVVIAALGAEADMVAQDQAEALDTIAEAVEARSDRIAAALTSLGYRGTGTNTGGPFVALDYDQEDFSAIANDLADLAALQNYARSLPIGLPIPNIEVTSTYGPRRDPFLGSSAMHTGVDLMASSGTPVHATGPGRVITAGTNGGYGRMVQIDHGNGIVTSYAHLSTIAVRVGQQVAGDAVIGRSGSTGRSTGPHLHYEIERNGRTIDPLPHLRASDRIQALL